MDLKQKLQGLIELIDAECRPLAEKIINEIVFTSELMDSLKEQILNEGAITTYKNGNDENQRQSPAFKGYYTLIPKFNALIKNLINLIPKHDQETGIGELEAFMNEYN